MIAPEIVNNLKSRFAEMLTGPVEFRGETTLDLSLPDKIAEVCAYAKKDLGFDYLVDITSVDNYGQDPRWTVVYELRNLATALNLRIKTRVSEELSELPTISDVWRTADWHEREIFDMMGIRFRGHPDLRRIIMWDGYAHHPLRKDFPLAGKDTDVPEVAFSKEAPLEGGPFVTSPGGSDSIEREPRAKTFEG